MLDPNHVYSLAELHEVQATAEPEGFADFWRRTYEEAMALPLRLSHRQMDADDPRLNLYEVEYDSLGGVRIGGWITMPRDGKYERGVVAGHGYGGRAAAETNLPGPPAVAIWPCARGFDRSAHPTIPDHSSGHVLHCIDSRETYSHRGSVADLWLAASALLELFPDAARQLHYHGGSFGGGMGALALPWDGRFHRAYLDVPSLGHHPLRLTLPSTGSAAVVQGYHRLHPEVVDVLAYFDAAVAARRLQTPTFIAAALCDPVVPPPGQFAVYNAISCEKELFVRQTGHPSTAQDEDALAARLDVWLAG